MELKELNDLLERIQEKEQNIAILHSTYLYIKNNSIKKNEVGALVQKGIVSTNLGAFKEAIDCFSSALSIEVDADAYYNRGTVYMELSDFNNAIGDLSGAIWYCPENIKAYHNRALCILQVLHNHDALGDRTYEFATNFAKNDLKKSISFGNKEAQVYLDLIMSISWVTP